MEEEEERERGVKRRRAREVRRKILALKKMAMVAWSKKRKEHEGFMAVSFGQGKGECAENVKTACKSSWVRVGNDHITLFWRLCRPKWGSLQLLSACKITWTEGCEKNGVKRIIFVKHTYSYSIHMVCRLSLYKLTIVAHARIYFIFNLLLYINYII